MEKYYKEKNDRSKPDYDDSVYVLFEPIDEKSVQPAVEWILDQNYKREHKCLHLLISSYGGEVHSGFALIDIMAGSKIPIYTIGLGAIASMGLMVFVTGKRRILTPNTLIMSHQFTGVNFGKEHELISSIKCNNITSEMIIKHLKKYIIKKPENLN